MATWGREEEQSASSNSGKDHKKKQAVTKSKINDEMFEKLLQKLEIDDYNTDILSSDSDDSSIEEVKQEILSLRKNSDETPEEKLEESFDEMSTREEDTLERMAFYSVYVNDYCNVDRRTAAPKPQYSDGYDDFQPYSGTVAYMKDAELKQHIIEDFDDEEFERVLKSGIGTDFTLGDIDGNISLKTLAEDNYKTLEMDGPTRKIALLFDYRPVQDENISKDFRDFMSNQKKLYHFIGGALLLFEGIGIQVVEGSEYVLLRHFPHFFDSEIYKKLTTCKVLGVEELSAMKSFKHYACYNGTPQELKEPMKEKISSYPESLIFLKKLGEHLNAFLNFAYSDDPNVLNDNVIPESIEAKLPPREYLEFALKGDWTPGLRPADSWYFNDSITTFESDDSEFVWPPRADHLPVHILHPTPEEQENLLKATRQKMKSVKLPCTKKIETKEEGKRSRKKQKFGEPSEDEDLNYFADILDEEYEFSSVESEKFGEREKGYDSQSSPVDPVESNPEMDDYFEIIENITKDY